MKIRTFALALSVLLLIMLCGCGAGGEKPLAELRAEDVASAEIYLIPPDSTITITDAVSLSELVEILNQLVIYEQDDSGRDYDGQLVQATITKTDGTTIEVGAYNPFLYVDGVCYRTEYEPCETLNAFGNSFYKELPDKGTPPSEPESYAFEAQYIRTDGYHEDVEYPVVTVIRSRAELDAYYEANKDKYAMERRTQVYSDDTIGFLDACDAYDDEFFEERDLILILLEEPSGSIRHEVSDIRRDFENGGWRVTIDRLLPESGTDDMAEWHIFASIQMGKNIEEGEEINVVMRNVDDQGNASSVAEYSHQHANMRLTLPDGWDYAISEYSEGASSFGISFWPKGYTDAKLNLSYWVGGFGVCGTGLEQEEITLANGLSAWQGTYDGHAVWDFICFKGTPGSYVVLNEGAEAWWAMFGDEAMRILGSAQQGVGIIYEADAIKTAEKECTVEYDTVRADFDFMEGIWEVHFYTMNTVGGNQTVWVSSMGEVLRTEYGE